MTDWKAIDREGRPSDMTRHTALPIHIHGLDQIGPVFREPEKEGEWFSFFKFDI